MLSEGRAEPSSKQKIQRSPSSCFGYCPSPRLSCPQALVQRRKLLAPAHRRYKEILMGEGFASPPVAYQMGAWHVAATLILR